MYSAVATSQKNLPARASLLILSISPAPPMRRYLTLMGGYLSSNALIILATIVPPVREPYQISSPSFVAFTVLGRLDCARASTVKARVREKALKNTAYGY